MDNNLNKNDPAGGGVQSEHTGQPGQERQAEYLNGQTPRGDAIRPEGEGRGYSERYNDRNPNSQDYTRRTMDSANSGYGQPVNAGQSGYHGQEYQNGRNYRAGEDYNNQGYSNDPGYSGQGYSDGSGYPNQGYPNDQGYSGQGYSDGSGYSNQGYSNESGYYGQGYQNQGYPNGPGYPGQYPNPFPYGQPGSGYPQPASGQKGDGYAIGSLVCGIGSLLFCACYGLPGIILGIVAIVLYRCSRDEMGGDVSGLARGGQICGIIGIAFGVLWLIYYLFLFLVVLVEISNTSGYYL